MKILELYEQLSTGEISLNGEGLCAAIANNISHEEYRLFCDTMCWVDNYFGKYDFYLIDRGKMTTERETFLLLYAAYKGELDNI